MKKRAKIIDDSYITKQNFAQIDGKRYPIKFAGYDRDTFKHLEGCLAYSSWHQGGEPGQCCQCGAIERAIKIYVVEVPPKGK